MKFFLIALTLFITINSFAQDEIDMTMEKSFIVVGSAKKYKKALRKAQKAANKLVIPIDLRGMINDSDHGLTSNEICGCGEKHGYHPRGRYDDGKYISIEYSSAYDGFTPGFYLIIVASGVTEDISPLLEEIQLKIKNAQLKSTRIYMGGMH